MSAGPALQFERHFARSGRRMVLVGSLILSCTVMFIVGIMLNGAREDAWEQARQSSENLKLAIIGDVQSQMTRYDQALEFAVDVFSGAKFDDGTEIEKQHLLDQMARDADIVGSVFILDKDGNTIAYSGSGVPSNTNFADRAYFSVHQASDKVGTFVSQPYESRLRNKDPSIAMSRRISDASGNFAGVVVIAIRLDHFHRVLTRMDIGEGSVLAIVNKQGQMLSRQPSLDGRGDVGRSVADSPTFQTAIAAGYASGVTTSVVDNVQRLYTIGAVPGFPMVVSVALATEGVLAGWWKLAIVIGPITLLVCIAIATLAFVLQRKIERLAATEARLEMLATTDGLTGLANRRHFDAVVETEWNRARRDGTSVSVVLIDADRFKTVNDRFGHLRGDDVLKSIAGRIENKARRAGDLAARFGGEEFIVLLPATRGSAAFSVAEAIRADIAAAKEAAAAAGEPGTTISLGVAAMTPDKSNSIELLLMAADQALYQAKAEGRNRSVLAGGNGLARVM